MSVNSVSAIAAELTTLQDQASITVERLAHQSDLVALEKAKLHQQEDASETAENGENGGENGGEPVTPIEVQTDPVVLAQLKHDLREQDPAVAASEPEKGAKIDEYV